MKRADERAEQNDIGAANIAKPRRNGTRGDDARVKRTAHLLGDVLRIFRRAAGDRQRHYLIVVDQREASGSQQTGIAHGF
ncbi:hypothetical protein SDC9_194104 [bioreactor metagenome]|uniref:Uncharacterized protein n=1 Tax=bioreactor metagenome TaxID=1076179 RepID=A0A645I5J0_9ZZZZ